MSRQNIHMAMGSLAYAIAKADGQIQEQEKEIIRQLAQKEFELNDSDNEWIKKMFANLEENQISLNDAYQYALDVLESNRFDFDFDKIMKDKCVRFMERIAEEFGGVSNDEQLIIKRFKNDMQKF
ncbi:MAG: TerB family tellurite resistance protein [Cytophagaceae bacterium]